MALTEYVDESWWGRRSADPNLSRSTCLQGCYKHLFKKLNGADMLKHIVHWQMETSPGIIWLIEDVCRPDRGRRPCPGRSFVAYRVSPALFPTGGRGP